MSLDDWVCNHCGVDLGDDCIRFDDKRDPPYCWECARTITNKFLEIRSSAPSTPLEAPRSPSNHDRDLLERLEAVEEMTRRVKNVWVLWLNDAQKGAINPGTFHTMKNLLGIDQA